MTSTEVLETKYDMMIEQNNKEHCEIKALLTTLSNKLDDLPEKFVTRLEFKAVAAALGTLSIIIWFIVWFNSK